MTYRFGSLLIPAHRVVATKRLVSSAASSSVRGLLSVVREELDLAAIVRLRHKLLKLSVNVQCDRAWILQPRVVPVRQAIT